MALTSLDPAFEVDTAQKDPGLTKVPSAETLLEALNLLSAGSLRSLTVVPGAESYGLYLLWDTETGEPRPTLWYRIAQQLAKKRADGLALFSTSFVPARGKQGRVRVHTCLLHPSRDERLLYDEMGLPVCTKSNIPNAFQLSLHMQRKHRMEWLGLEETKKETERKEEREWRQSIVGLAVKEESSIPRKRAETGSDPPAYTGACEICGKTFGANTQPNVNNRVRLHKRSVHKET